MSETKQTKLDKRATALRDNLKRRKLKDKESQHAKSSEKETKSPPVKKED